MGKISVECPDTMLPHVQKVIDGEYDIPGLALDKPVIIDLGANVGSFSVWAAERFPDYKVIHAYEPNEEALDYMDDNCGIQRDIVLHRVAVGGSDATLPLYTGKYNLGEASLIPIEGQPQHDVKVIDAASLPPCDLLKLDVEGSEGVILHRYPHLNTCKAVVLEWHNLEEMKQIDALLTEKGFVRQHLLSKDRVEKYVHKSIAKQAPNVMIGVLAYGGMVQARSMFSLIRLALLFNQHQVNHMFRMIATESLISRGRNDMVRFMTHPKHEVPFTHLFFPDMDVAFEANDVMTMLLADKDIIGLPYARKSVDWNKVTKAIEAGIPADQLQNFTGSAVILDDHGDARGINQPLEVNAIGTGTMLAKREVFDKMREAFPEREYTLRSNEPFFDETKGFDYFQVGKHRNTGAYESEDYSFCLDAKELGFGIWILPNAKTVHIGQFDYVSDPLTVAPVLKRL